MTGAAGADGMTSGFDLRRSRATSNPLMAGCRVTWMDVTLTKVSEIRSPILLKWDEMKNQKICL